MKNFLISFLMLLTGILMAQKFEGTMKWRMKMEISDPAVKDKAGETGLALNDPAMQAKMREMQAQMNNPQIKAMMESNPQLKAQMEKMMGGGFSAAGSTFAINLTVKVKAGNMLTLMEGGMMGNMEILFLKEKNQSYRLDRKGKTWSQLGEMGSPGGSKPEIKIIKTLEVITILNYSCTKQIVEITEGGKTSSQIFWTTTDIKDFDLKSLSQQRMGMGGGSTLYYDQLEGTPLKIELSMPEGNMTMEAIEISNAALNENDFMIPADFKETKLVFGKF